MSDIRTCDTELRFDQALANQIADFLRFVDYFSRQLR
jgi:hypothetical protein